ncbi:MAG: hypothetical protein HYY02_07010 [Chloroflexi bacterium]|nr:hypothetical protein [Chloroflexota bacterium]
MIYWAPLLHFYQPPLQLPEILRKVCVESYQPLVELFQQYPHSKVTVNICGVLTEMLWESGHQDIITGLTKLAERGQLEFTGSAKYHPILPLVPKEEMSRQIRRNHLTSRHFFGDVYDPRGFFLPELAYSQDVVETVAATRHQWLLLSGVACPVEWAVDTIYQLPDDAEPLAVFFRDDILSNKISFQTIDSQGFLEHLRAMGQGRKDVYVITAMDAETFGHHIQNWDRLFLGEVYEALQAEPAHYAHVRQRTVLAEQHRDLVALAKNGGAKEIEMVTISELLSRFPKGPVIQPHASSWSTSKEDLAHHNPFPLWKDPQNPLHQLQWEHMNLTIQAVQVAEQVDDNAESQRYAGIARGLLDPALHSCQFWWASQRPMWDVNMILRGLHQQEQALVNALKAVQVSGASPEIKRESHYRYAAANHLSNKAMERIIET